MAKQARDQEQCLHPACGREQSLRGLCRDCYESVARAVRQGKTTWAAMERQGKVLPVRLGRSGKRLAWFLEDAE